MTIDLTLNGNPFVLLFYAVVLTIAAGLAGRICWHRLQAYPATSNETQTSCSCCLLVSIADQAGRENDSALVFAATGALYQLLDPNAYLIYALLTGEKKSGEGLIDSEMKMLKDPKAVASMGLTAGIGYLSEASCTRSSKA